MERLSDILQGVDLISDVPFDVPVQSISSHSKHVAPGCIFVAVPGKAHEGANFIPEALRRGAAVIVSNGISRSRMAVKEPKTTVIQVQNPRRALSRMAANFYEHPSRSMTVVGITGTNGKTTTALLLHSILEAHDLKIGLIGTLGIKGPGIEGRSNLTTPDIIDLQRTLKLFLDGGVTHVVMEVSSHALEMNRVADVEFDAAVFTNFTQDHLDFHQTMENYFRAKTKLFAMLSPEGKAILNASDGRFGSLSTTTRAAVTSYSVENSDSDISYQNWGMSRDGCQGTILAGKEMIHVNSSLLGIHNVENILCASAAAWSLGIPTEAIERGIEACDSVPGRLEIFTTKTGATVVVDYAHTPDAYHKLFSSLKSLLPDGSHLWVIFGCGGDRDPDKRPLMAAAAEKHADKILVTPDNPRTESLDRINDDIKAGFKTSHTFYPDRGEAIQDAVAGLQTGDVLAIVGKGRENCQIVGKKRIHYSDIETVKRAISEGSSGDEN